jgi:predicted ATPase/DNA-binding SARP family transcriptional activator
VRVDLLGTVTVTGPLGSVSGLALGGRRARLVLAALALAGHSLPADRLAAVVWPAERPPTWPVALRGVVRSLRSALAPAGADGSSLILTTPAGYALADGATVDVALAAESIRRAQELIESGSRGAAIELLGPIASRRGDQLLPEEDSDWVTEHRATIDAAALWATELLVVAAGLSGEGQRAVAAARDAVSAYPLDERSHRALIAALSGTGDRAAAVRAYETCRSLLDEQLGVDPSPQTVAVYLEALREQASTSRAVVPSPGSTFVGRSSEQAELRGALAAPGLVSLAGPGGVGKSRLVTQVAQSPWARSTFLGGRLWVSLATVGDDALVAPTVGIGVVPGSGGGDPTEALARHLAPLGPVLLVLDGCEAVVDGVASLTTALRTACPTLTLVVTSRVPLSIDDERVIRIDGLPEPATGGPVIETSDQVRLLQHRVRDAGGELSLDAGSRPLVAALLRRCAGLPLAIEIAAAQLAAMSLPDLLDHLAEVSGDDDPLTAVARSSYLLLDDDEATVFRRLSVLDGPVTLPLVRAVVADDAIPGVRVVRLLRELTVRGLLSVDRSGPRWCYQQDDELRRLAADMLASHGEDRRTLERLADTIRGLLPDDPRAAPAPYLDDVTAALGPLRSLFGAALDGRIERDQALELAFRLHRYWAATSVSEGRFWLSRLLAAGEPSAWSGYATYGLGYLSYWAGDANAAMPELTAAVDGLRGVEDSYVARALIYLGGLADDNDLGPQAVGYVREAIEAAGPYGVDLQVGAAMGLACVLGERADPEAARYAEQAIALCRTAGSQAQLAATLPTAAMVCWQVGALAEANGYVEQARPLLADGRRIARVVLLSVSAGLALAEGDLAAAVEIGRTADAEATELGVDREVPLIRCVLARSLLASGDLDGAADRAVAALDAAAALTYTFPLANCLETAALLLSAGGHALPSVVRDLLAAAAAIRVTGDRPVPPTLREEIEALWLDVGGPASGDAVPLRPRPAAALAGQALTGALTVP